MDGVGVSDGDPNEEIRLYCTQILNDIEIIPITTGLTNQNYQVRHALGSVFVRVFGPADFNIERPMELAWRTLAAERGLSPRILGSFKNGWVEEFAQGKTWNVADLKDDRNVSVLAALVSKLHALTLPAPVLLYDRLLAWAHLASTHPLCPPLTEIAWLTTYLKGVNSPIVFCHNDLQEGNLLHGDTLVAVDFEFSGLNPRGFDLANLFCEMAIDNQAAAYPGFVMDFTQYPSRTYREAFYKAYGETSLERETEAFVLASHLLWALWAMVQANASNLKFGFIEYAEQRLAEYYKIKHLLV